MMTYKMLILIIGFSKIVFAQIEPVIVADLTLKVGGLSVEEVYYGFAEGDEIVFSFEELKGKGIKEIEIVELPGNSKFMDFKSLKIEDKKIKVNKMSVYLFKFYNSAVSGRVCKIQIKRIPKSVDLISFNTDWKWETMFDTTYVPYVEDSLVGYDTLKFKETVKELIDIKQIDELILDKTERVHSYFNENGNKTYLKVILPKYEQQPYREERIITWAYWIGVGEESSIAYAENLKSMGDMVTGVASTFASPLAGLAVGTLTELFTPKTGEDVEYVFINDFDNIQAFLNAQAYYQFDKGKGVAAYGKHSYSNRDIFYIGLYNDNQITEIDVNVKIVVIKEIKTYEDKEYEREKVTPRYVKLNKNKIEVKSTQVRVNSKL